METVSISTFGKLAFHRNRNRLMLFCVNSKCPSSRATFYFKYYKTNWILIAIDLKNIKFGQKQIILLRLTRKYNIWLFFTQNQLLTSTQNLYLILSDFQHILEHINLILVAQFMTYTERMCQITTYSENK